MQIKIFESAKEYLIENFGNLVSAGEVYFDKKWYMECKNHSKNTSRDHTGGRASVRFQWEFD